MHEKDLYAAIDLHSNNNFLAIIDQKDHRLCEKRLKNEMSEVLTALSPFKERIHAIDRHSTGIGSSTVFKTPGMTCCWSTPRPCVSTKGSSTAMTGTTRTGWRT
jgi:hypothetical protein